MQDLVVKVREYVSHAASSCCSKGKHVVSRTILDLHLLAGPPPLLLFRLVFRHRCDRAVAFSLLRLFSFSSFFLPWVLQQFDPVFAEGVLDLPTVLKR